MAEAAKSTSTRKQSTSTRRSGGAKTTTADTKDQNDTTEQSGTQADAPPLPADQSTTDQGDSNTSGDTNNTDDGNTDAEQQQTATPTALVAPGPVHNPDPGDSTPAGGEIKPDDNPDPSEDPAAAVKAARMNMRVTQPTHPGGELTEDQRVSQLGISSHSVGGSRTLLGGTPEPRVGVGVGPGYDIAETDAYVAWVPKNAKQPTCVRAWSRGQRVRKDVLEALSPHVGETAQDAPVLDDDQYRELAAYL